MTPSVPCPYCGSGQTLPFEKEKDYQNDETPDVAVYAGITLVTFLLGIFLFSVIFFRALLFVAALTSAYLYKQRMKKRRKSVHGYFVCLQCSRFFPH